jgi:integrase
MGNNQSRRQRSNPQVAEACRIGHSTVARPAQGTLTAQAVFHPPHHRRSIRGEQSEVVRILLKGINTARKRLADGSLKKYYYHRGTGKRITGEPGTPEFVASYAEAAKPEQTDTGTFSALITGYAASPEFGKLAEKTRKDYRRYLDSLRDQFGNLPIEALSDHRIREDFFDWRDKFAKTPRTADYAWSILRRVLSWAYDRGKVSVNHAIKPGRLYDSDRSDLIWLPEHVEAFCSVAPSELQVALILAIYTGQRQGDLLSLTWGQYDGDWIKLRQSKGGRLVEVPVHRDLRAVLDKLPRKATIVLTAKKGLPWKSDHFRHQWRKATRKAKIKDLHFHDLRGTAVTMLAESGCSNAEIAAITGHSQRNVEMILEKYTARTRDLARSAMTKLENAGKTDFTQLI